MGCGKRRVIFCRRLVVGVMGRPQPAREKDISACCVRSCSISNRNSHLQRCHRCRRTRGSRDCLGECKRRNLGGVLIAASVGLKPQIGLVFLAYYFLQRGWKICGSAIVGIIVMASAGLLRMAHVSWLASYEIDNRTLLSTGVLGDFTERNPTRFGLVNLQVALYPWLHHRSLTNICVLIISAILAVVIVVLIVRASATDELLSLSLLSTFSLLPVYHRFYDAALLMIPLCWLIHRWGRRPLYSTSRVDSKSHVVAVTAILTVIAFSIPGGSILEVLQSKGAIPSVLTRRVWWNGVVMAHAVWILLLVLGVLLWEMNAYRQQLPATTKLAA